MDLSLDWVEAWNHSNLIDVFEDLRRDHFSLGFHVGFSQSPIFPNIVDSSNNAWYAWSRFALILKSSYIVVAG